METFDIVILLISTIAFIVGYATGMVMQLALLVGVILGTLFSGQLATIVSPKLIEWFSASPHKTMPISYIIAFLIIFIIVLLIGRLLQSFFKAVKLNIVNRLIGAIFSLSVWIALIAITLSIIEGFDKDALPEDIRHKSIMYPYIKDVSKAIVPYLHFN